MNNRYFQFSLDTSSKKYFCPQCQRKTFVLYIDNDTGQPLSDGVGRCDRLDNCAYHYTPKQFFEDNPDVGNEQRIPLHIHRHVVMEKPRPIDYINLEVVQKANYLPYENRLPHERNTLFQYIAGICGNTLTQKAFVKYGVGTAKDGATIFWQWDEKLNVRTGKIIRYKADGHRDHDNPPFWAHTKMKSDFNLKQCLFGQHLLSSTTHKVAIVESEKTAIVASIYYPEFVWLATGGICNLQPDKCEVLRNKDVVLFPDLKATEKWREKANHLRSICRTITVSDYLERIATDEERAKGLDLADFLLRNKP